VTDPDPDADLQRLARELTPPLYALARVLRLRGVAEAGLSQLPPSEFEVLRYVLDQPGVSVGVLARDLGLHTSNASTTLRALVARRLVRREPDPADRRISRLTPTPGAVQGMALIEDAWAELFAHGLAGLGDEERSALAAAAPALRALAKGMSGAPGAPGGSHSSTRTSTS
jgi:DNA-binding MarR family transcriptional regulator